jgi:hypothetical protein
VHGCAQELDDLLRACGYQHGERLVLLGDLVAKGPDSAGVLTRARALGALAVKGNHDAHVLRLHAGHTRAGKAPKPEHRQVLETLGPADWAYLEALPLWLSFPELGVVAVHAGLVPGVPLEAQQERHLLTLRSLTPAGQPSARLEDGVPWASRWTGPLTVLFGHDAVRGLQRHPFALGLDTGCVYGGALSAWALPEGRLHQVPARRDWAGEAAARR